MVKTKYRAMSQAKSSYRGLSWCSLKLFQLTAFGLRLRCEAIGNVPTNWTKLPSILTAIWERKNHSRCSYNDFALLNNSMKEAEAEQQGLEDLNEGLKIQHHAWIKQHWYSWSLSEQKKKTSKLQIPCIDMHIYIKCLFSYESYSAQIWTHPKTLTEGLFDSSKSRSLTVV